MSSIQISSLWKLIMMRRILTFLLCMLCVHGFAQNADRGSVSAKIQNEADQPVENATVSIVRAKDSVLVKAAITDKSGNANFENIKFGEYRLKVNLLNYAVKYSDKFLLNSENNKITVATIALQKSDGQLANVTVAAKKPFIQRLNDRLIVNVDNSVVNVGSTAFEVLERSPGVAIDPNDVISLRGRQGVTIMIDGKITPMTGADLANMLRSMPANSIESIHLITNPSAKYDAAGNSGIIDIRMKKDQRLGFNGTYTAGYGQGVYPKANTGINFNYRNKKVNVFGSYNYTYRIGLNHLFLDRNFYDNNGAFTGGDLKDNYSKAPLNGNNARFGADFFPSKNTIIGFVVTGAFNHFTRENNNSSTVIDKFKQPSFTFNTGAANNDYTKNGIANVNFKHKFDDKGKELTADVDYGEYRNNSLSTTSTKYYELNGTTHQPDYILNGDQAGKLSLKTAKADYVNPLPKGAKFEIGFKTSHVSSDNNAKFFDLSSGVAVDDVNKTNRFFYKEDNNAGYFNFSKDSKKINFQFGLRAENTNVKTEQVKGNIKWDSSYLQFFPSAYFTYKLKEDQSLGISVSRRIDRPGYSQLNPFLFLIDVSTYATGNPGLLPQMTWSYEMNYNVKNLNFTLGYSHTNRNQNIAITRFKDVFPNIPSPDNVTVQIPVNLESYDYYGLTIAAPVRINKVWNMINNSNLYYGHYNGKLGQTTLNNGKPSFDLNTSNTFTLKKGWSTELNGTFSSGGQYGFMVSRPQWGVAAGVQKSLWKNKGTLRFNVTDIFWTNLPKATITYTNYIERWHAQRETRVANISFTYRFGKNTVAAARRRTTGSEEERQRAQ
jgi:iron complex outermembrane receptor protein